MKTLVFQACLICWDTINLAHFSVELKVTKGRKLKFSPHQIAWHVQHPKNSFILAEARGPRSSKLIQMFPGSRLLELAASGLELEASCLGLEACCLKLSSLGACSLALEGDPAG